MNNYIRIESVGDDQTKVEIHGNGGQLIEMLANAIVNDMNLGMLVLSAMDKIANEKNIHNINLN
jgi:phage tail sheath gpL-like